MISEMNVIPLILGTEFPLVFGELMILKRRESDFLKTLISEC